MILSKGAVVNVESAEYVEDYKLRLIFNDNRERTVDFEPFLTVP